MYPFLVRPALSVDILLPRLCSVFCSAHRRIWPLLLGPARLISENIAILKQLPILRLVETLSALDCLTEQRIRAEGGNLSQVRPRSGTIVCKNVWVSPSPAQPSPSTAVSYPHHHQATKRCQSNERWSTEN